MCIRDRPNTILLDGGMGTMLQAAGLKLGARPEELNITDPQPVSYTHLDVYKRQERELR